MGTVGGPAPPRILHDDGVAPRREEDTEIDDARLLAVRCALQEHGKRLRNIWAVHVCAQDGAIAHSGFYISFDDEVLR